MVVKFGVAVGSFGWVSLRVFIKMRNWAHLVSCCVSIACLGFNFSIGRRLKWAVTRYHLCFCVSFRGHMREGVCLLFFFFLGGGGGLAVVSLCQYSFWSVFKFFIVGIVLSLGCLRGRCVVVLMLITGVLIALVLLCGLCRFYLSVLAVWTGWVFSIWLFNVFG